MKYSDAGVDIDMETRFIKNLVAQITFEREDFKKANLRFGFTGLIEFGDYYIAMNTDGVGSKIIIANKMRKWDTMGIDCIAMNVNDTITVGAEPIAFVDYLSISCYDMDMAEQLGKGLNEGAKLANVTILGGETATLPDITKGMDLAGTSVGIVRKEKIITGEHIKRGDIVIGIPSNGIHSNGLSLARKVFPDPYEVVRGQKIGLELLKPTRIYVRDVMNIIDRCEIHGMAHITGGGLLNILRLKEMKYIIEEPLKPQWIFEEIANRGNVPLNEMYRTFNMGMGFAIIAPEECETEIKNHVRDAKVVGYVDEGRGVEISELGIKYP